MIQNKKRIISLILMLTLLVSALVVGAITASAEEKTVSVKIADQGWTNEKQYKTLTLDNNITVTVNGGTNSGKYYDNGTNWRIYQNESPSITVQAVDGVTITSVKFTYNISKSGVLTYNGENKASGDVISINAASATFGVGNTGTATNGQVRITAIEVVYETSSTDPEVPACEHTNTEPVGEAKAATCTEAGITAGEKCSDCGTVLTEQEVTDALGHNYVNGTCSACGAEEPSFVFKKVTATPADWSGTYLIVYEDGNVAFNGASTTLDSTSNYIGVTIDNDKIAFSDQLDAAAFTIEKSGSNYTIKSASGYYIGQDSNKNGLLSNQTTTYSNTISLNSDGSIQIVGSGTAVLRYNATSGQYRFRYFKSDTYTSQKAICLYKLLEKEAVVCTHEEAVYTSNNDGTHNVVCECGYAGNNLDCSGGETSCVSGKRCEFCGFEYDTEKKNHNYLGGSCSACPKAAPDFSGRYYIAAIRSSGNYWYMTNNIDGKSDRYLIADSGVTELPSLISKHVLSQIFVLESVGDGIYYIYAEGITGDAKYLGWTGENSGTLVEKESEHVVLLTVDYLESEVFNIHFATKDAERYLSLNSSSDANYFAFYKGTQSQDLSLIPVSDHVYADATCTAPKTCACGATEGEALGHKWSDATCIAPKTCSTCKTTEGEALGHKWSDATCTAPKTCSTCKTTEGDALGHKWSDATCTAPKTCSTCKTTEGEALGHDWDDATCTAPKTCRTCGATEGKALGHTIVDGDCPNCEETISFDEAIKGTGTVVLNENKTYEREFIVPGGVTIDLGGHDITATGTITFDSSARFVGNGRLFIPKDKLVLSGEASSLPVWHEAEGNVPGYYTFNNVVKQSIDKNVTHDGFKVLFRPSLGITSVNKELFTNGANDYEFLLYVYKVTEGTYTLLTDSNGLAVGADLIQDAYENGKAIGITITGADANTTYAVKLVVKSNGLTNTAEIAKVTTLEAPEVEGTPAE